MDKKDLAITSGAVQDLSPKWQKYSDRLSLNLVDPLHKSVVYFVLPHSEISV